MADPPVDDADVVVAHWGEHVNGGGDRVAWELSRVFPDDPLYVGWRDASIEPDDVATRQIINGRLSEWGLRRDGAPRMLAHLLGWQIAKPLRSHDVLVTSGNEPLFYIPPTDQTWIAYVHHTNRRQSDQIHEVGDGWSAQVALLFYYLVRIAFDHNTHKPDLFVANSEHVKRRIVRYWGVPEEKIKVVYPPVETESYDPDDRETGSYYLTLSRLDWHKAVDEVVRAFGELGDRRLVVAGDGPERERLERIGGENVEFRGYVSEAEKRDLLAGAKAFVFNGRDEDFGISPVEALAAGTPLLGVREGMTQYQVVDGKNGYTYTRDESGSSIVDTVHRFENGGTGWSEAEIAEFADRFSVESFRSRMRSVVREAVSEATAYPNWYADYADGQR